eukprot:gene8744-8555_t
MLAPGLVVYNDFIRVPKEAYELEVVAQQWQWTYRFPGQDGKLGKSDIKFVDATNPLGIDPMDPAGQDDFCGVGHYNMRGQMIVEEQGAFDQWLSGQPTFAQTLASAAKPGQDSVLEKGRQWVEQYGCSACHSQDG